MPIETTYTRLREHLASMLDRVVDDQEVVIVRRRGSRDVAIIPTAELTGLVETAHLLRSPKNARRLLAAFRRSGRRQRRPESLEQLRREMGLDSAR
jgi:antitoxin YefM